MLTTSIGLFGSLLVLTGPSLNNAFSFPPRTTGRIRFLHTNQLTQLPRVLKSNPRKHSSAAQLILTSTIHSDPRHVEGRTDRMMSILTSAFPLWVIGACVLALKKPMSLTWVNNGQIIESMLAFVMVGMGMTLEKKDFEEVFSCNWSAVPFGVLCQFGIMPVSAWIVGRKLLLPIDPSLYLGLALVGCSPGGTASNLVSLIAGANVALSVLLTACSTILAAAVTPPLVKVLVGGTELMVSGKSLCFATAKVVLGPVLVGMLLNSKLPALSKNVSRFTPLSSVILVAIICGGVMAKNATAVLTLGDLFPRILLAVVGTHTIGFVGGYGIPRLFGRYSESTCRTISIETGMQNSALAVVLAQSIGAHPLAALPGAISALTHSCLGSLIAAYWRIKDRKADMNDAQ